MKHHWDRYERTLADPTYLAVLKEERLGKQCVPSRAAWHRTKRPHRNVKSEVIAI